MKMTTPCLRALFVLAVIAAVAAVAPTRSTAGHTAHRAPEVGREASVHLALGNPSGAASTTASYSNYLIVRNQYALAYSRTRGIPKWVSWHLGAPDLGDAPRTDSWRRDSSLPAGWYRVRDEDYNHAGYDRGHMCPSEDRTATIDDNRSTFLMTNAVPQAAGNNRGPWARFEEYCRDLVRDQRSELYIVAGSYGRKGSIAEGRVAVPMSTWKVAVVLPQGNDDLARINAATRVIALRMPNREDIRPRNWREFRTSVDSLEQLTHYDFLSPVADEVETALEARVDSGD